MSDKQHEVGHHQFKDGLKTRGPGLYTKGLQIPLHLALALYASSFALPQLVPALPIYTHRQALLFANRAYREIKKLLERDDPTEPDVRVGANSAPKCKIAQATAAPHVFR